MTATEAAEPQGTPAKKAGVVHEFVEIVKTVAWALGIALVLRVLLFQPFTIPSASMEPALYQGDYIIVSKWTYGYSRHSIPFSPPIMQDRLFGRMPERGDIAVFKLPRDDRTDYIKRVIGLPGDQIRVAGGRVYVNGVASAYVDVGAPTVAPDCGFIGSAQVQLRTERLPNGFSHLIQECDPADPSDRDLRLQDDAGQPLTYRVPEGHLFMMGDNRDNSVDSRYSEYDGVGLVPVENLVGKAEIILLSWTPEARLFLPWTWVTELRPSRFFKRLH